MATHSNLLVWRIPWAEEPGRLQPTGWQRVGHDGGTGHVHTPRTQLQRESGINRLSLNQERAGGDEEKGPGQGRA